MARSMKDSGIPWIGEIPIHRRVDRIKNHFNVSLGKMVDSNEKEDKLLSNYLCAANIKWAGVSLDVSRQMYFSETEKKQYILKDGDVLIMEGGATAGTSCVYHNELFPCYMQNSVLRCRPIDAGNISQFLFYWMYIVYHSEYIDAVCNAATFKHFTKDKVQNTPFVAAPLHEQQRIANFLDAECARIDSIIAQTRATVEEYKKLKQSIITQAVTKGIRPNRPMKDSGIEWIGEIPEEWDVRKIKNGFSIYSGATPKSEIADNWDGDIVWITPADYKTSDKYVLQGKRNISTIGYESCGTTLVPQGSIVFSKRAPIGTVAIAATDLCTNQGCLTCVPSEDICNRFYYYTISVFTEQFNLLGTGTTFKEISYDTFCSFKVPYAPFPEQCEIADYLDEKIGKIDELIIKKEVFQEKLNSYKKSLIYEYVTGKKEVL